MPTQRSPDQDPHRDVGDVIEERVDMLSNGCIQEQREAARILATLGKERKQHRDYIQEMGAIPLLVDRLSSPDISTRGHMMALLFHLAGDAPFRFGGSDKNDGIYTPIYNLMRRGPGPKAYETAAKILISLSNLEELKETFSSSSAINALIDILRYRKGRQFQKDAIAALSSLLAVTGNRTTAAREGIAPILLRLIVHGHPKDVDMHGILLLMELVATDKEGREELNKIETFPALTKLVEDGKLTEVHKERLTTISKLLLHCKHQCDTNLLSSRTSNRNNRKKVSNTERRAAADIQNDTGMTDRNSTHDDGSETSSQDAAERHAAERAAGSTEDEAGSINGSPVIPNEFRCPISLELMKVPVIVATGQTYERQLIQKWLDGGKGTCPNTRRPLPHTNLQPNVALSALIQEWCKKNGVDRTGKSEAPSPQDLPQGMKNMVSRDGNESTGKTYARSTPEPSRSSSTRADRGVSADDKVRAFALLDILRSKDTSKGEQMSSALELHNLAKNTRALREEIINAGAVPILANLLSVEHDADTHDIAIQLFLTLSVTDQNKRLMGNSSSLAVPAIVDLLKHGSRQAREKAIAVLLTLSLLDENKVAIGATNAIPVLVDILPGGDASTKKAQEEAVAVLLSLSMYQGNKTQAVRAGVIPHLIGLLDDEQLLDRALAMLGVLSSHSEGRAAIEKANIFPTLVATMRSGSNRNKENALTILSALIMKNPALISLATKLGAHEIISDLSIQAPEKIKYKALSLVKYVQRHHFSNGRG